jgi:SSS family solute:Na+ symporter
VILVVLGLLWIPFMKYISPQLYIYLQSVQAYIAPPIAACFLLGILSPRLNGSGAVAALGTGFVFGAGRLGLELAKAHLPAGTVWSWIAGINFLHYAALLFVVCTSILVAVSLATPAPAPVRVADLTLQTVAPPPPLPPPSVSLGTGAAAPGDRRLEIALSVLLAAVIGVLWIVFR